MNFWESLKGKHIHPEEKSRHKSSAPLEPRLAELEREKIFLSAILSSLVESVVAVDQGTRILFINTAAEKLFGVDSRQCQGRPLLEALRHSPLNKIFERTLTDQKPLTEEILLHAPAEHVLSVQAAPVSYGEGRTGALAALHDITELRKLESIRREFVANVSHELKTPLTSIKGYAETLLDGAIDDPKHNREFLKTIQEHVNNLSRLIDDVLDLSAMEAERAVYRMGTVHMKEIVERIAKALEPMARAKKVSLVIDMPASLPTVYADTEKLAQIVMNLIENAIKFNRPDGRVRVSAKAEGKELRISVEDTGRGIAADDLPRVFERFYRGNKDRSHEIPGTGLGLAIVKHLIEAHKGTVSVQSVPGQGSTFIFKLPLA